MRNRGFVSLGTFAVAIMLVALAVPVSGQTGSDTWAPPRTPDGQPDLQGIWTNETITAFERPAELADKAVLTEEEARALEVQNAEQRVARDGTRGANDFWGDPGTEVVETRRTSLVVDSPRRASRAQAGRRGHARPQPRPHHRLLGLHERVGTGVSRAAYPARCFPRPTTMLT